MIARISRSALVWFSTLLFLFPTDSFSSAPPQTAALPVPAGGWQRDLALFVLDGAGTAALRNSMGADYAYTAFIAYNPPPAIVK